MQTIVNSGEIPLDDTVMSDAEAAVTTVRADIQEIPEIPSDTEEIKTATATLNSIDYSAQLGDLKEKQTALENSIKQLKQVTNPAESFIVERLEGISTITGISAVTEDNDPNGQLNKQGGYTATVYFTDSQVNQDEVYGETIIDKGTDGGGSIEVYLTVEEAESRNTYLGSFDGSALSSGSQLLNV